MSRTYKNQKPQVIKPDNFLITYNAYNESPDPIQRRSHSSGSYIKKHFADLPTKNTRHNDWIIWRNKKSNKKSRKPIKLDPVIELVTEYFIMKQEDDYKTWLEDP